VWIITLMVLSGEIEELKGFRRFLIYLPKKKGPDGKPLHKAVEELVDLHWLPDEFALNRWQHVVVLPNSIKSGLDGNRGLIWHPVVPHLSVVMVSAFTRIDCVLKIQVVSPKISNDEQLSLHTVDSR